MVTRVMSTERGFTLVELILAIVILSVGVAGVLVVFSTTVKSSADPVIRKNMLSIADQMMEEIVLKPYAASANTGLVVGCARAYFNDINDYDDYNVGKPKPTGICDAAGEPLPDLAAYSVEVTLDPDSVTFATQDVTLATKITVTVTKGTESLSLVGWRTNYAL